MKYLLPTLLILANLMFGSQLAAADAEEIDMLDYLLSDHPNKSVNAGGRWTISQATSLVKKWSYVTKLENPDKFMVHTWDNQYIYLKEDRTGPVSSYSLSPGIWMKRFMKVGEMMNRTGKDVLTIYGENCNVISSGSSGALSRIGVQAYYRKLNIDHIPNVFKGEEQLLEAGNLGDQEIVVHRFEHQERLGDKKSIEMSYYSKEWGLVMFAVYEEDETGETLKNRVVFNKIKDITILPDTGAICNPELIPPDFVPTPFPTPQLLPGDLDRDGDVDNSDFNLFVSDFGKTGANIAADIDKNGVVDIFDYNILVGNFGR